MFNNVGPCKRNVSGAEPDALPACSHVDRPELVGIRGLQIGYISHIIGIEEGYNIRTSA